MSNIISNDSTFYKEFGSIIDSFENDLISLISSSSKATTDSYNKLIEDLDCYVELMRKDASTKYPISKNFIQVSDYISRYTTISDENFSRLSSKVNSLRHTYISYVLIEKKGNVLKDSLVSELVKIVSSMLDAYVSYIENLSECLRVYSEEIEIYRKSLDDDDYISRLNHFYNLESRDDLVMFDGKLISYTNRTLEDIIKLISDRGYIVLIAGNNNVVYFKGSSFIILPLNAPVLKMLQCYILKEIDF